MLEALTELINGMDSYILIGVVLVLAVIVGVGAYMAFNGGFEGFFGEKEHQEQQQQQHQQQQQQQQQQRHQQNQEQPQQQQQSQQGFQPIDQESA